MVNCECLLSHSYAAHKQSKHSGTFPPVDYSSSTSLLFVSSAALLAPHELGVFAAFLHGHGGTVGHIF